MDYKEKYDEALKRARKELQACGSFDCDAARQIFRFFPELAENKDKRIREWLIDTIKSVPNDSIEWDVINKSDVLDWLEKQGEHANFLSKIQVGDKVTRNEDGVLVNISQLNRVAKKCKKQGEQNDILEDAILDSNEDGLIAETIRCKKEKQDEQKSADKVEPKFRIGDVIEVKPMKCQGKIFTGKPNKIVDITEKSYILDDGKAYNIELQDGWKLSEQKSTEWSEEDEKNSLDIKCLIGSYRAGDTEYRLDSWIDSLKDRVQPQPKQEWSEEDETNFRRTEYAVMKFFGGDCSLVGWLRKSLKGRFTWKPSDEQMEALCKFIDTGNTNATVLESLYDELKKLKA